jgi:hypothetical protein
MFMQITSYEWKLPGLSKGLPAEDAAKEFKRIEQVFGALTPENIVKAAEPQDSLLHKLFEWNNQKAADLYRLQQARTIINNVEVKVISDGEPRTVPVFEIITQKDSNVYKSITEFDESDLQQIRKNAVRELNYWKNKLSFYKEFSGMIPKLDKVIAELEK